MRLLQNGRWMLVLLGLFGILSVCRGEEASEVDGGASSGDSTEAETETVETVAPTEGEGGDGENEEGDEGEDDDEAFDVNDLLPGVEKGDENFIENYIMGVPEHYTEFYVPSTMVTTLRDFPRFTHSNNFAMLMGNDPDEYILGIIFIGTLICSLFMLWAIILSILKCIGPRHVGVLAGFPFREEGKKSVAGRMVLSVSAWMMITATIVMITKGMTELQALSDTVDMANFEIKIIEKEVTQIVTTLMVVSAKTTPIRDELVDFLKRDICPLEPGSDTEDQVRSVGEDTYDAMVDLDDFIEGYLEDVESGVNQTSKFTNRIDSMVKIAQFTNNWKVTVVLFPFFIVPSFILVAVCMGWFDVFSESFYTFITWVILPLMVVLTFFAVVASAAMVVALQANSDLCMPLPENTIQNILDTVDLEPDSSGSESKDENGPSDNFFYDVMLFYTNQCTKPNPWEFMEGHYVDLSRGRNILGEFLRSIADTTLGQLSQECGHEYGPIVELLLQLQDLITLLAQTSIKALNLMSCRNIVPIYTMSIYEATCTMAPRGLSWCLGCTLVISFFGMLSIMFRGAYYPIDYYYYEEKDLYPPTEDEMSDEGNECNDLILKQQRRQCEDTIELMREENVFDVYNDDEEKESDTEEDDDTETEVGTLLVGGENYSVGTYEDNGYGSLNGTLTDGALTDGALTDGESLLLMQSTTYGDSITMDNSLLYEQQSHDSC